MTLLVPTQKNGDHFWMPKSPQNGGLHVCFMLLALLGGFKANFGISFLIAAFPL